MGKCLWPVLVGGLNQQVRCGCRTVPVSLFIVVFAGLLVICLHIKAFFISARPIELPQTFYAGFQPPCEVSKVLIPPLLPSTYSMPIGNMISLLNDLQFLNRLAFGVNLNFYESVIHWLGQVRAKREDSAPSLPSSLLHAHCGRFLPLALSVFSPLSQLKHLSRYGAPFLNAFIKISADILMMPKHVTSTQAPSGHDELTRLEGSLTPTPKKSRKRSTPQPSTSIRITRSRGHRDPQEAIPSPVTAVRIPAPAKMHPHASSSQKSSAASAAKDKTHKCLSAAGYGPFDIYPSA